MTGFQISTGRAGLHLSIVTLRRNESRSFKQRTLNELRGVMIFGAHPPTATKNMVKVNRPARRREGTGDSSRFSQVISGKG